MKRAKTKRRPMGEEAARTAMAKHASIRYIFNVTPDKTGRVKAVMKSVARGLGVLQPDKVIVAG